MQLVTWFKTQNPYTSTVLETSPYQCLKLFSYNLIVFRMCAGSCFRKEDEFLVVNLNEAGALCSLGEEHSLLVYFTMWFCSCSLSYGG